MEFEYLWDDLIINIDWFVYSIGKFGWGCVNDLFKDFVCVFVVVVNCF